MTDELNCFHPAGGFPDNPKISMNIQQTPQTVANDVASVG
jgi:hypothetical protein